MFRKASAGPVKMRGTLGHWGKILCFPECGMDCIYFPSYYYFKSFFVLGIFRLYSFDVCSLNMECIQKH